MKRKIWPRVLCLCAAALLPLMTPKVLADGAGGISGGNERCTEYRGTAASGSVPDADAFAVTAVAEKAAWVNPFTDVNSSDWFFPYVQYIQENTVFFGADGTAFSPNAPMTRGMFWTVLYRLEGDERTADLSPWEPEAQQWAVQNGISDGSAPDGDLTREQLAVMLYRYAVYQGYDTTQGGMAVREFEDYDQISDFALSSVAWTVNAGLVCGAGNALLQPKDIATRAQVAAVLTRFLENVAE